MNDDQITGWKEIAAFVHTSERTAQRWEGVLGLPVHRLRTPKRAVVFARCGELSAWLNSADGQKARAEIPRSGDKPAVSATGPDPDEQAHVLLTGERSLRSVISPFSLLAAVGTAVILTSLFVVFGLRLPPRAAPTSRDSEVIPFRDGAPVQKGASRPVESVLLRISIDGERTTQLAIPEGALGRLRLAGHATLGLSPVLFSDGMELHVVRVDGESLLGTERVSEVATVRVERGGKVRLDQPFGSLEVEWMRTLPAPRRPPKGRDTGSQSRY